MDPWFTNSATVWILTEPFLLLGPQCCLLGVYLPEQRTVSASLSWVLAEKVILSTLLYWHGNGCSSDAFCAVFSPQALSLDKRCRDSRQKRQRQQGVWNQQSRSDACWWDCNPKWTALKGRTEVLPNYGTSSSKILLNYLNSQLHHRFIFNELVCKTLLT